MKLLRHVVPVIIVFEKKSNHSSTKDLSSFQKNNGCSLSTKLSYQNVLPPLQEFPLESLKEVIRYFNKKKQLILIFVAW